MDYLIGSCNLHIEEELINQFWSHLDSVEDSWALSTREFRKAVGDKVIPLGFYGDEACMGLVTDPYNQIYGLFMSVVLFRPTSTRMSRYLLFSVDSHRIHSVEETFFPVLEQITASFNRLSNEGVHGRHFLVSEIRGDQSFLNTSSSMNRGGEVRMCAFAAKRPQDPRISTTAFMSLMMAGTARAVQLSSSFGMSYPTTNCAPWALPYLKTIFVFVAPFYWKNQCWYHTDSHHIWFPFTCLDNLHLSQVVFLLPNFTTFAGFESGCYLQLWPFIGYNWL